MIDRFRRSTPPVVEEPHPRLKAAEIGALLAGATAVAGKTASQLAEQAREAATGAREWAAPHVASAIDWTSPRVQKAWADAYRNASPHVEKAAGKALPVVDVAHDRFVQEVLPRFMAAMTAVGGGTLRDLVLGRDPIQRPPGCGSSFQGGGKSLFTWENYCHTLDYLRTHTSPRTRVGGFFRNPPFPTVNAPAARLPLFPSPGGILWLRYAAPGLEPPFLEALEQAKDSVVVWTPGVKPEFNLRLERLEEMVRRLYEPEARFGKFEVWRRKPEPAGTGAVASESAGG